jgi:hypothetical protein
VRLTAPHHKKLLLRNLKRGGQGPIWAVGPLDGWMEMHVIWAHFDRGLLDSDVVLACGWLVTDVSEERVAYTYPETLPRNAVHS